MIAECGEGIVLRKSLSQYHHGRSDDLLKFKAARDAEGLVVDHLPSGSFVLLA